MLPWSDLLKSVPGEKFPGDGAARLRPRAGGQQLFHIFSDDIRLQVHQVPLPALSQDGLGGRVGDDGDGKAPFRHRRHSEADAVDGDGALLHHIAQNLGRGLHRVPHGGVVPADAGDLSHPVHMASHDVPAEAAVGRHGPLQVHPGPDGQPRQGGAVQGLVHDVGGKAPAPQGRDGEADAVDGDAVPDSRPLQHHFRPDGKHGGVSAPLYPLHGADLLNDPGEHTPPRFPSENPPPAG